MLRLFELCIAYEFYQQQISQCDRQIEQYLTRLDSQIELEEIEQKLFEILTFLPAKEIVRAVQLLHLSSPYFEAVVLEAAMPTQLLTIVIADNFQLDTRILAQCICFNTLIAFFTLPLVQSLLLAGR